MTPKEHGIASIFLASIFVAASALFLTFKFNHVGAFADYSLATCLLPLLALPVIGAVYGYYFKHQKRQNLHPLK